MPAREGRGEMGVGVVYCTPESWTQGERLKSGQRHRVKSTDGQSEQRRLTLLLFMSVSSDEAQG